MGAAQTHTGPSRGHRGTPFAPPDGPTEAGPDQDDSAPGSGLTLSTVEETPYGVALYWPSGKSPYFRLTWVTADGQRKYRSGGRTHDYAWGRACQLDDELAAADAAGRGSPNAAKTINELTAAWLAALKPSWSDRYNQDQGDRIAKWVTPGYGHLPAGQLNREDVRIILAAPPSRKVTEHLRATVGGLLSWAYDDDWTSGPRSALLPKAPNTAKRARGQVHGENRLHINTTLIPGPDACRALAEAMRDVGGKKYGLKYWLMEAIAASTGVRQGELFALRPSDADLGSESLQVLRQLIRSKGVPPHETLPKWGRTGTTFLPSRTIWGADLHGPLEKYMAGMGPGDLLFPTARKPRTPGQRPWMVASNFDSRVLKPARDWARSGGWDEAWSWHANRHAFCSDLLARGATAADVCLAARHKDPSVTLGMYYSATAGSLARLSALA